MNMLKLVIHLMIAIPLTTQLFLLLPPLQRNSYGLLLAALLLLSILILVGVTLARFIKGSQHSDIQSNL